MEIPLTQGLVAVVDDCDADLLEIKWWISRGGPRHVYPGYSERVCGKWVKRYMHRVIAARIGEIGPKMVVDHINRDTLDNRRENLRIVTQQTNIRNRRVNKNSASGIRGVRFYRPNGKWQAHICVADESRPNKQRTVHLGYFQTIEEAIAARKAGEERLWGGQ